MPSQLQWEPGYTGLRACVHATSGHPPQLISQLRVCAFSGGKIYMDVGIEVGLVQSTDRFL